ncbi:hypothetical protein DICPUDRAFT_55934 [Dictyostelium purpureum]|uniref:phospholipase D n=1 Tax=Dictyostelium purpureum TaxID=5786 RepID=F0ZP58_DICPU|nr:uncharacterized protein DICPUDRAFT_55934 [Dictyostelium purpureum]EGC34269.1 hypothetical protein DICPUDRAFT_55934 [Dictyostelium purpureum]|eukprot:XP_003289198.1 hypothetical protein DICPUDRAFT_55934 [Dictyostelium purpureum]
MYFFTPPQKKTLKPVIDENNNNQSSHFHQINDKIPKIKPLGLETYSLEDEKYLYNISYFSKEEIKILYDLFHRINLNLEGLTENIIFQTLSFLVHLPKGIDELSDLFFNEDLVYRREVDENHRKNLKFNMNGSSKNSSPINRNINIDINIKDIDDNKIKATTTTTTTAIPRNNNIIGNNTDIPSSSATIMGANNNEEEINLNSSHNNLNNISPNQYLNSLEVNSNELSSIVNEDEHSTVSTSTTSSVIPPLSTNDKQPEEIEQQLQKEKEEMKKQLQKQLQVSQEEGKQEQHEQIVLEKQSFKQELFTINNTPILATATLSSTSTVDSVNELGQQIEDKLQLKEQLQHQLKVAQSTNNLNNFLYNYTMSSDFNVTSTMNSIGNLLNTTNTTNTSVNGDSYYGDEEEEDYENEDTQEKIESINLYKSQFSIIQDTNLWSGKTLKEDEFDYIDSSSEVLKYRMIINYLCENLFSFIRKRYNIPPGKNPSIIHIIEMISIMTRGTLKEKSELVFKICKKKSENVIYKSELLELVQSIDAVTVLNVFGLGSIGSPDEVVNNIFREGLSTVNSIQRTPNFQRSDSFYQKSMSSELPFKDTCLELKEFVKRSVSNSDIPRCFGFFDLIYLCYVKPIEDYLKSSIKYKQASGYLYYEKYLGIIKAYSLRWFEVRSGFLIGYKRLFSKPSKVICLFKTNVKIIPKEHPKHHMKLKSLFKGSLSKQIDGNKEATDFVLRRYDDTEQTFISLSSHRASNFVNAIRENSKGSYRYHSFASPQEDIHVIPYINGNHYLKGVYKALKHATSEIYIAGWWISPNLSMNRTAKKSKSPDKYRLDSLLMKKASEGVKIYVLVWDETMIAMDLGSRGVKSIFEKMHRRNIKVIRHPHLLPLYWSHHQKVVVVDQRIAFIGGLDLCFGRYDNEYYYVKDNLEINFPGADYINSCIAKPVNNLKDCLVDRNTTPRMPWHDVSIALDGKAARDVTYNFIQRWNHAKDSNRDYKSYPYLLSSLETPLIPEQPRGTCKVQIVRSVCGWSAGQVLENSIYKAYLNLINLSQHFIYIQNQFFISSVGFTQPNNQIAFAIYKRIEKAIILNQVFRVIILLPVHCEGDIYDVDTQLIIKYTSKSINGIKSELLKKFPEVDIDQYLSINSLRNWDANGDIIFTEQIYVHSKVLIVDDKIAIIGSANINDRSLNGTRDSEICAIIEDRDLVDSRVNGLPYKAAKFAHNLRCNLWEYHLGLISSPDPSISDRIKDLVIDSTYHDIWRSIANNNSKIYKDVFGNFIPETCRSISQLNRSGRVKTTEEILEKLCSINGFLINYPLDTFLVDDESPTSLYSDIITSMKLFL